MMSHGTWNERESECALSVCVVGFFEWGEGVILYRLPVSWRCPVVRVMSGSVGGRGQEQQI